MDFSAIPKKYAKAKVVRYRTIGPRSNITNRPNTIWRLLVVLGYLPCLNCMYSADGAIDENEKPENGPNDVMLKLPNVERNRKEKY